MEFRKVHSLGDLYEISDCGILRNVKTGKILKGHTERNGYQRVRIENKLLGRIIRTSIHQLVAEAFLENPEEKEQVNHKDMNKQNNHVSNLEWVTPSENMKHAYANGKGVKELAECRERNKKRITNGTKEFESISEASRWLVNENRCKNCESGIAGISAVLRNKRKSFGGYEWSVVA